MRRSATTVLAAAAASALLLAGCSSAETATTAAPASSSSTSAAATTSASGAPSEELAAWASSFCTAASPVVAAEAQAKTGTPTSPAEVKPYLVRALTTLATALGSTATSISALDTPPTDGAEQFVPTAAKGFTAAATATSDLAAKASATDAGDTAALAALAKEVSGSGDPVTAAFSGLDAATPEDLDAALSTAPACAPLRE